MRESRVVVLPSVSRSESGISPQEIRPTVHPLQAFAVEADYARDFFAACQENAKRQLPWLIKKNPLMKPKDLISRHIFGLYDAYQATRAPEETKIKAIRKFELDWGDQSEYLQAQVRSILPGLDKKREESLLHPETIEPYDVYLAKRRARRALVGLPENLRQVFTEMSDVDVESRLERYAEMGTSAAVSTGSLVATDAAAGASAAAALHFDLLKSTNIGLLIAFEVASYGSLIYGIAKNVRANMRLKRETGVSMNPGFTAGSVIADSAGTSETTSEKTSVMGQYGFELIKDSVWNAAIVTAVLTGQLTIRDALILSTFANLGGTVYELSVAAGTHGVLAVRREIYNHLHPFPGLENSDAIEEKMPTADEHMTQEVGILEEVRSRAA